LHIYGTTTLEDKRKHYFWFVERRVCISSLRAVALFFPLSLLSFFLYAKKP